MQDFAKQEQEQMVFLSLLLPPLSSKLCPSPSLPPSLSLSYPTPPPTTTTTNSSK
jgi:hypothetical protein